MFFAIVKCSASVYTNQGHSCCCHGFNSIKHNVVLHRPSNQKPKTRRICDDHSFPWGFEDIQSFCAQKATIAVVERDLEVER